MRLPMLTNPIPFGLLEEEKGAIFKKDLFELIILDRYLGHCVDSMEVLALSRSSNRIGLIWLEPF